MKLTIKAIGDTWELDVLGIPYGSINDKDSDRQFFSQKTNLHDDKFPLPPVVYYHGWDETGRVKGTPEYIGKTISYEDKSDGRWYRVALDKTNEYARRVWEAAKKGLAEASSGSISHLVRIANNGHIDEWPVGEMSLIDVDGGKAAKNRHAVAIPVLKAVYKQAGLSLPDIPHDDENTTEINAEGTTVSDVDSADAQNHDNKNHKENNHMGEKENPTNPGLDESQVADIVAEALKADREAQKAEREAEEARESETKAAIEEALKAQRKEIEEEAAKGRRLPFNADNAPTIAKFSDQWKYDNLDDGELSLMVEVLQTGQKSGRSNLGASEDSVKALARRVIESKSPLANQSRATLKAYGAVKADEVQYSTLASYGNDFVPTFNSSQLWANIVEATQVAAMLPSVIVPQGSESITIPVEGANPTFYKVAQATAQPSNLGHPTATVTSSKKGTTSKTLAVDKLGCSTLYTGELEEDSIIPWMSYIRNGIVQEGSYVLDHVIIDGDTATGATTNINDIGGTPAGTEAFLIMDGLRKSPLVTTTANSFSGGVLDENDFIRTIKMMGLGGKNALDKSQVAFLLDLHTYWKALEMATVKTGDVYSNPTIENGELVRIWGYQVMASAHMHRANQDATYGLKADANGKIDLDTVANNTTGSLLAFRKDQWLVGWKRRMTIETQRYANADTTEIVGLMRVGMTQRDTEASAITYNLTV